MNDQTENDLIKDCPFCGGVAVFISDDELGALVKCKKCDMGTHNGFHMNQTGYRKMAIDFWNTRVKSEGTDE